MTEALISEAQLPLSGFDMLESEATASGQLMLQRLQTEWDTGTNRFDRPGEVLLAAHVASKLVGIGGLNRDPFVPLAEQASVGRLRHMYVLESFRSKGIGRQLAREILKRNTEFKTIRLRTGSERAGQFYEQLGFMFQPSVDVTHQLRVL